MHNIFPQKARPSERDKLGSALVGSLQIPCCLQRDFWGYSRWPTFIFIKITGRTFFPNNMSKSTTFAAAPLVFTLFVRNQVPRASHVAQRDGLRARHAARRNATHDATHDAGHIYIYIYIHTCICISLSLSLSLYIYIYTNKCVCTYIYIYIHNIMVYASDHVTPRRRLRGPVLPHRALVYT